MKSIRYSALCILTSAAFLTGCATTGQGPDDLTRATRAATIAKTSARSLTLYAIAKDPNSVDYLRAVAAGLETALAKPGTGTNAYNPDDLIDALNKLPIDELQTVEAQIVITTLLGLYEAYWADRVTQSIDENLYLRLFLAAIKDGIQQGLPNP